MFNIKKLPPPVIIVIASGAIYFFIFTFPYLLPNTYQIIPPVDYSKLSGYSPAGFIAYVLGISALFGLYVWAIRLTVPPEIPFGPLQAVERQHLTNPALIFGGAAIFAIILIFSYPLTAIDLFIYAIRTRGWALHNLQPLAAPPQALPTTDPWLGLAAEWIDAASPYGPLWEWLSLAGFYLSGDSFLAHLFWLKIIAALAYVGCAWLVYRILTLLQPKWAIAGTIAFAWNPLVLFESSQNAHNDIVMVLLLMAAVWRLTKGQPRLANQLLVCLLLALSILVKFVTVLVTPFFLLALAARYSNWPRRITAITLFGLGIALVVVAIMAPFWPGWEDWAVLKAGSGAGRSLMAMLVLSFRDWLGTNLAFDLSRNLLAGIFGLIFLYHLWQTFSALKESDNQPVLLALSPSFYVLFWYVLLAVPVFHAWYLLWFVPLATLLLPRQKPLVASIVFSITALLAIPYFETVRIWYPLLLQNHLLGHLIGVPLLVVPPAIAMLWPAKLHTNDK